MPGTDVDPTRVVPHKPLSDKRAYRVISLGNRLTVGLISDPEADKGAAALTTGVGSMNDPSTLPGLSHFLEHMLFLGTTAFPEEGSYKTFLKARGGGSNASTSSDATTYHFFVHKDSLLGPEGGLARFCSFFTGPLLTPGATNRELNAVDSENSKNLNDDGRRSWQARKALSARGHPFAKFGTGDRGTLTPPGVDLRAALLAHYDTFYSSNLMSAAVLGKESLDELEAAVRSGLEGVADKDVPVPVEVEAGHPYQRGQAGRVVLLTPVRDIRSLEVLFPLPASPVPDFGHASRLLSHSLGYEGSGSLLAALKARGWASALSAGASSLRQCTTLSMTIALTPEGLTHVNDVVRLVLQYGQVMREAGDGEWSRVHADVRQGADNAVRFKPTTEPVSAVTGLAMELVEYPPLHALTGRSLLPPTPDLSALRDLLACVVPANMVLLLSAQGYNGAGLEVTPAMEPYYGFSYGLAPFSAGQRAAWGMEAADSPVRDPASPPAPRSAWTPLPSGSLFPGSVDLATPTLPPYPGLTLPPPNPFIPTDFSLKPLPRPTLALPELSADGAPTEAAAGVAALAAAAHEPGAAVDTVVEEAPSPSVAAAAPVVSAEGGEAGAEPEVGEGSARRASAAATPASCTLAPNPWDGAPSSSPVAVALSPVYASTPLPFPALFPVPATLPGLADGQRVWWHQDDTFRLPKTYVDVRLALPSHKAPVGDAGRVVTSSLATSLISEVLNEGVYDAECAGLRWGLQTDSVGGAGRIHVYASGYSHTLPTLLSTVLTRAAAVSDEPDAVLAPAFERLKDGMLRSLANFTKAQPHSRAREAVTAYLTSLYVGQEEALEAARGLRLGDVREYARGLMTAGGAGAVEVVVSANTDAEDARGWMRVVKAALPPAPPAPIPAPPCPPPTRVALLAPSSQVEVTRMHPNSAEPNAAVDVMWQLGPSTPRVRALASLLAQAWAQPAFDTLRTKEQLGYTVFSGSTSLGDGSVTAVYITVQGQVASAAHLQARIEAFVSSYRTELEGLSEEAFEARKAVLSHRLTEPNKTQGEAHGRLRAPIDGGRYVWGGAEATAAAVRAARLDDLKRLYDEALLPASRLQRKFVSRVYAQPGAGGPPAPGSPVHDGGPSTVPPLTAFEAPSTPAAFQARVGTPPSFAFPPTQGGEAGVWAPTLIELPTGIVRRP